MNSFVLTINGGSSSIKFALFQTGEPLERRLDGRVERIGLPDARLIVKSPEPLSRNVAAPDYSAAVNVLAEWLQTKIDSRNLAAVGHRLVHGGPKYWTPQHIAPAMLAELEQLSSYDPEHLPEEIQLARVFHERFPHVPQIACFDTAFHHDMPRVARLLPIPRRYDARGVRRYGFHGLSCAYLLEELERLAGAKAAHGRVILAHLGNGASVTAVRDGKSMDTSMSFTPTAGLPMSTRSGDLDPGLAWYFARTEEMTPQQFHQMINRESGLLGVSEISSDMRELLAKEIEDVRAAEAVSLFCYQTKKWICALAGVLDGLDSLVFSGGIGENAPPVRERICQGLDWMGIKLDRAFNDSGAPVISAAGSPVSVRVIPTDEESIIARTTCRTLGLAVGKENET